MIGAMSSSAHGLCRDLGSFIDVSPSPFHAVAEAARRLGDAGFTELDEAEPWGDQEVEGARFVRRGGSLVAWNQVADRSPDAGFAIVGAHTDSPNLRIKPQPDTGSGGVRQLGVEVYGGALLNSWLDRDLGISGRLVVSDDGALREHLVLVDRPVLRVPQLAIHLDREINSAGLQLNAQTHMKPIWGEGKAEDGAFAAWIAEEAGVDAEAIRGWDLMAHDLQPSGLLGADEEWFVAPRIDNQASCHAALTALIDCGEAPIHTPVVCLFDHEEVGSTSSRGAAGSLLPTLLGRIADACETDLAAALARSACVSADGAHATHPNYADRHEPGHNVQLNGGPVIKRNSNERYATDALGQAIAERACLAADVPFQRFVVRSDMACGSTIGPVTAAQLGITTVDVGIAQLSMHSARELCGATDPQRFIGFLSAFFEG
jgi:aspartyl aminopeptidase